MYGGLCRARTLQGYGQHTTYQGMKTIRNNLNENKNKNKFTNGNEYENDENDYIRKYNFLTSQFKF